jgi:hypothetical protein
MCAIHPNTSGGIHPLSESVPVNGLGETSLGILVRSYTRLVPLPVLISERQEKKKPLSAVPVNPETQMGAMLRHNN